MNDILFDARQRRTHEILENHKERTYKGQTVLGRMEPERVAKLQKFYLDVGFIKSEQPIDELYTNAFVE